MTSWGGCVDHTARRRLLARRAGGNSDHAAAVLVVCCAAQFMGLFDVTIVNVALPSIRDDLGATAAGLQWVITAYTLALAGCLLLGGRAADLLGRRAVFVSGLVVFGLASLIGGLAQESGLLVAARAGQGVGGALTAPTGLSILTTTFAQGAARNRALAWWGTMGGLGGATGALIGGLVTETLSWRWLLLLNAPVCLLAAAVAWWSLPARTRPTGPRRPLDVSGGVTVTAALVLLTLGIVETEQHGLIARQTLGPAAGGIALLAVFVGIEARLARAPLIPLGILRSRALSGASVVVLCLGAVTFAMWFLLTLLLQRRLGLSPIQTGLAFAPMSLMIVAATRLGGRLATQLGPGRVVAAGMAVLGTGMLLLTRIDADTSRLDLVVPSLLCAAGIGGSFVPSTIAATSAVAGQDSGLASGLLNTAYQVGSSLGVAVLAAIAAGSGIEGPLTIEGFRHAFLAGAAIAAVGSAVALGPLRGDRPAAGPGRAPS